MKNAIKTLNAPAAVGPYSQAIEVNGVVYTAGQLGVVPETGEFAGDTPEQQAEQALRNIKAVLEAAGSSVQNIVKTTIFVTDLGAFVAINEVYNTFLDAEGVVAPPARSTVEVAGLPLGGLVEVEAVAVLES